MKKILTSLTIALTLGSASLSAQTFEGTRYWAEDLSNKNLNMFDSVGSSVGMLVYGVEESASWVITLPFKLIAKPIDDHNECKEECKIQERLARLQKW